MAKKSAGVLVYRRNEQNTEWEYFLVQPGGPYYFTSWSIPKGGIEKGESLFDAAHREFMEETGSYIPADLACYKYLGYITYKSEKQVHAYSYHDEARAVGFVSSNTCEIKHKGQMITIPENQTGRFVSLAEATELIKTNQIDLIHMLIKELKGVTA